MYLGSNITLLCCQASLDKDPSEMAISAEVLTALKRCNTARLDILRSLFSYLGLDCDQPPQQPRLTPVYLLPTNEVADYIYWL